MFSSLAKGTRSSAAVVNPFAPTPSTGGNNPFGVDVAGSPTTSYQGTVINPFQTTDGGLSDRGGKQQARPNPFDTNDKRSKSKGKFPPNDTNNQNGLLQPLRPDSEGPRATSPSKAFPGETNNESVPVVPYNLADPLARKVYEQLREDGIGPPAWPSQPGNPKNKQAMAKFREQYETYRKRARASLTRAGLIDDPEKRKTLSDAIDFKGICEDMCPEFEKITRITEQDVVHAEKDPTTTYASVNKMVKKLARSAAGQEAPLPMDVRSVPALRRTLDYLVDDLLRNDGNLPVLHGFLWDRTRAIRRDFSFFSSLTREEIKTQVYVLENIARFHVTALHLLSQEGNAPEDFVQQQELEQLGKALLSLRDVYDDCGEQGIKCENEPEFRAYYLVFYARDPSILETLQRQWKPYLWRDSDEVRTAISLVEALQGTHEFHGPLKNGPSLAASAASQAYFRIVRDPKVSYTMACFAECHFPYLRRSILKTIKRALARPKDPAKDVSAAALNKFLQFDTIQHAIDFAELHNLKFVQDPNDPSNTDRKFLVLDSRRPLPHRRLQHQFSQSLVERKRGTTPLPEVIHRTVFEDPNAAIKANGFGSEASLFVPNHDPRPQIKLNSGGFGVNTDVADTATPPALSFATTGLAGTGATPGSRQSSAPFGTAFNSQPISTHNPFAATSTSTSGASTQPSPFAPGRSTPSLVVSKTNGEENDGSTVLRGVATTNPFASSPQITGKSAFGGSKSGFPSTAPDSLLPNSSTGSGVLGPFSSGPLGGSKSISDITSPTASLLMPPPPLPQPKALPKTSDTPEQNSDDPASLQEKPAMLKPPGFESTPHQGTGLGEQDASEPTSKASNATSDFFNQTNIVGSQTELNSGPNGASSTVISPLATDKPAFIVDASTSTSGPSTTSNAIDSGSVSGQPGGGPLLYQGRTETTTPAVADLHTPVEKPRDLMGDFTRWFVMGDNGILEQFRVFLVDEIARETFKTFQEEVEQRKIREEEEAINEEVERFRTYNLSLKYFYRWKQNARGKRLSALRRSGRDQLRAFYASQHAAERRARKEATEKAVRQQAEQARVNRPEEFLDMLKQKKMSKRKARDALLSSGVLSGMNNEHEVVESIVGREFRSRSNSVSTSCQSRDSSPNPSRKLGGKTKALRDLYLAKPGRFRRSLPSTSSRASEPVESARSMSNASARWRLKAMGIVQLPDGTAVPESIAHDMMGRPSHYSSLAFQSTIFKHDPNGRASVGGGGQTPLDADIPMVDDGSATNKRKRCVVDDDASEAGKEVSAEHSKHKRIMSEAEKLTSELKAIRQELEEGREWFKSQNERLRSESRAESPWFEDSI
ncbi:80 kD MCM3-associated protein [Metarhizium rileyi]|uniref:80 kD MCM3-associated protein n=1 Tax=Metarhizium rileyi (strain RCEF 4871) TaxID=1649241 RepID=A0A167BQ31_METRR|nr:80 kD MCM3-associated protein [Metarhizium rileyi RCEF 4871]